MATCKIRSRAYAHAGACSMRVFAPWPRRHFRRDEGRAKPGRNESFVWSSRCLSFATAGDKAQRIPPDFFLRRKKDDVYDLCLMIDSSIDKE